MPTSLLGLANKAREQRQYVFRDLYVLINEEYLHYMRTGRPFVHLKLAVSLDGKIATRTGDSHWVTGPLSGCRVHELRHAYDAILVGAGTVAKDDPALTDRSGLPRRRPLVRVVLDDKVRLSPQSQLATTTAEAPVPVVRRGLLQGWVAAGGLGTDCHQHLEVAGASSAAIPGCPHRSLSLT